MKETRIIAEYLIEEGYNSIGDRDIDFDEYAEIEVRNVEEGRKLIEKNDKFGYGIGRIYEERQIDGEWHCIVIHEVSEGVIYDVKRIQ